jgi:hypothetical protein
MSELSFSSIGRFFGAGSIIPLNYPKQTNGKRTKRNLLFGSLIWILGVLEIEIFIFNLCGRLLLLWFFCSVLVVTVNSQSRRFSYSLLYLTLVFVVLLLIDFRSDIFRGRASSSFNGFAGHG